MEEQIELADLSTSTPLDASFSGQQHEDGNQQLHVEGEVICAQCCQLAYT